MPARVPMRIRPPGCGRLPSLCAVQVEEIFLRSLDFWKPDNLVTFEAKRLDQAEALCVQLSKCLHQVAADKGEWTNAQQLLPCILQHTVPDRGSSRKLGGRRGLAVFKGTCVFLCCFGLAPDRGSSRKLGGGRRRVQC